ncbi:MAG: phosphatidylserine decarboxylase [Planctomycetaceae bacterium]|nr:phosphatidylserine decarboxylase [Planctomycetaceae bacterium]
MDEIVYYDRYREALCTELVYGDEALRWTYGTTAGRIALHVLVKRVLFSRWYGWWMDRAATRQKIKPFIEEYQLDASEFVLRPEEFGSFNEFFFRKLKPEARPIDPRASSVVFPADGRHLCVPDLSQCEGLFVKGEMFDLETLVGDRELARRYERGSLLLSRLCPTDYHRFHFPVSGTPGEARLLNGPLFSVNPIALCQNIQILATNKRVLTKLTTESCGTVLVMEIGATCVGGICQTYQLGAAVSKGDEKGHFRFGGSSTIMIFEPGRIAFDADLIEQSRLHRELYAHMGDAMGSIL